MEANTILLIAILAAIVGLGAYQTERRLRPERTRANHLQEQLAALLSGPALNRRVVVSLVADEGGVDGILTGHEGEWVRLEQAKFLTGRAGADPVPADGVIYVPLAKIVTLQDPT